MTEAQIIVGLFTLLFIVGIICWGLSMYFHEKAHRQRMQDLESDSQINTALTNWKAHQDQDNG